MPHPAEAAQRVAPVARRGVEDDVARLHDDVGGVDDPVDPAPDWQVENEAARMLQRRRRTRRVGRSAGDPLRRRMRRPARGIANTSTPAAVRRCARPGMVTEQSDPHAAQLWPWSGHVPWSRGCRQRSGRPAVGRPLVAASAVVALLRLGRDRRAVAARGGDGLALGRASASGRPWPSPRRERRRRRR